MATKDKRAHTEEEDMIGANVEQSCSFFSEKKMIYHDLTISGAMLVQW